MHERISVNQLCFPGADVSTLAGHWAALGARRVSFVSPVILGESFSQVQTAVGAGAVRVETVAHVFLDHLSLDEATWQPARATLGELIRRVATLGARSIYLVTGGHGTLTWEQAAQAFCTAVAPCVAQAREAGIALMIENALPQYADLHIAHSLRDTVQLAEVAGIGVNIDLFGCWTESGLHDTIARAAPRCHVVQVSDYVYGDRSLPGRAVPGDGALPLGRLLGWILSAGYGGAFDLELIGPRIDQEGHRAATGRAAERLGALLRELGA